MIEPIEEISTTEDPDIPPKIEDFDFDEILKDAEGSIFQELQVKFKDKYINELQP